MVIRRTQADLPTLRPRPSNPWCAGRIHRRVPGFRLRAKFTGVDRDARVRWRGRTTRLGPVPKPRRFLCPPRSRRRPVPTAIRPFRVDVPQAELDDLRRRIAATRWPSRELVADRSQGVQLATMQELARYWATDYDWRKAEAKLNALPQFTTEIDGVDIHFIHVRSRHENALPLIMTHGWPGSVIELLETVGPLTDPTAHGGTAEDAFHLVLPSLPGYGFSGEPAELGWDSGRTARAWAELMHRLGYTRYVAQGGDVGAPVTRPMGRQAVEGLVGYPPEPARRRCSRSATTCPGSPNRNAQRPRRSRRSRQDGFGYFLEMATRPQTIGYSLLDSPVGLAAWMLDHDTDSYYKISRAFVDGEPVGSLTREHHRRQHHAVLADGHRTVGGPVVLGVRTSAGRSARGRPAAAGGQRAGRLHDVPRRDLGGPAQLGRGGLPRPRLLQRGRQGRPLRRLGGAAAVQRRDPRGLQIASLDPVRAVPRSDGAGVARLSHPAPPSASTPLRDAGGSLRALEPGPPAFEQLSESGDHHASCSARGIPCAGLACHERVDLIETPIRSPPTGHRRPERALPRRSIATNVTSVARRAGPSPRQVSRCVRPAES